MLKVLQQSGKSSGGGYGNNQVQDLSWHVDSFNNKDRNGGRAKPRLPEPWPQDGHCLGGDERGLPGFLVDLLA
jgi:hypothetical protein